MALCGVVAGMCFVVLAFAFVRDESPRRVVRMAPTVNRVEVPEAVQTQAVASTTLMQVATTTTDAMEVATSTRLLADEAFKKGPFRVIKLVESPNKLYTYVIATARSEAEMMTGTTTLQKTINVEACGSVYSQPVCFLFREGKNIVGSDPQPKLVSAWTGGAFFADTAVKFAKSGSSSLMQFTTTEGDAGCSAKFSHQVDLTTGQYTLLKRTDKCTK